MEAILLEKDILLSIEQIRIMRYLHYETSSMLDEIILAVSSGHGFDALSVFRNRINEQPIFILSEMLDIYNILSEYGPVADKLNMIKNIVANKNVRQEVKMTFKSDVDVLLDKKQKLLKRFLDKERIIECLSYEIRSIRFDIFREIRKEIKNGCSGTELPFIGWVFDFPSNITSDQMKQYVDTAIIQTFDYPLILNQLDLIAENLNKIKEVNSLKSNSGFMGSSGSVKSNSGKLGASGFWGGKKSYSSGQIRSADDNVILETGVETIRIGSSGKKSLLSKSYETLI